jgi:hypothetical protein
MSRSELLVLLSCLDNLVTDLRDLRWQDTVPQHVVMAADENVATIGEAAKELRRLHKLIQGA